MNKKGFTLAELIGVIVLIGLLIALAFPPMLKQIQNTKSSLNSATEKLIISGASDYIASNKNNYEIVSGAVYCITLDTLVKNNFIPNNLKDVENNPLSLETFVKVEIENKAYKYSVSDTCKATVYKEDILNGADPVLNDGMIAITIDNDGTARKADLSSRWYRYSDKKWANAVTVKSSSLEKYENAASGDIISESDILTYFVWIPRYKYKLWYVESSTEAIDTSKVHAVDIVFESASTTKSTGSTNGEYLTHPSFTFGSESLNGIWVGKFETGYSGASSSDSATSNTKDTSKIVIKPTTMSTNIYSWRSISLSNAFSSTLDMNKTNNIFNLTSASDVHLMKNTDWGAVLYLAHSNYGINSSIRDNNNSSYLTGCGRIDTTSGTSSTCENMYGTVSTYPQSTTGNITGIFDMNGGAKEFVMGYNTSATTTYGSSGFTTTTFPASTYVDSYSGTTYTSRILGDATGELGPFNSSIGSWYNNNATFVSNASPWFVRGGSFTTDNSTQAFDFGATSGSASTDTTFRIVIS